jgi:hypothetical protein
MALISISLVPVMLICGNYFIQVTASKQKILSKQWEEIFAIV